MPARVGHLKARVVPDKHDNFNSMAATGFLPGVTNFSAERLNLETLFGIS